MSKPTVGLKDLHFAKLTSDEREGVVYGEPKRVAKAISAGIAPTVNTATLNADDGPSETASSLGTIAVTLNTDALSKEVQAELLGHRVNDDGVLIRSSTDQAPYVALGFRSEMSNGKYKYVWLFKGKFTPHEQNYQTKQDTPAFQTPTINATFLRRTFDDQWQAEVDEGDEGVEASVIANWFEAVYSETEEA